ncbi:Uncharacterised protein [Mycobacteroides abscessus subsp. abscessus]|nr:Uncharacterised protein [Mycobacteroides abscessus subsp. abscessus]
MPDAWVGTDNRLDLAELDAVSPDLDLLVGAADELQFTPGIAPHQVTGAIEPPTRTERVGHKPLGGEHRPGAVASRQLCTTEIQLADNAGGDQFQRLIQHVGIDILIGPTDRHDRITLGSPDRHVCRTHHRFGGPIVVAQFGIKHGRELVGHLARKGFTTHRNMPKSPQLTGFR